jgi:hypothetical protein
MMVANRLAKKTELDRQLDDICDKLGFMEKQKDDTEKRLALKARFLQKYRAKKAEAGQTLFGGDLTEEKPQELKDYEAKVEERLKAKNAPKKAS